MHGLLDDDVKFLEGWFKDTMPEAPVQNLSLLRLDGDYYGSTIQVLEAMYDKVSPGGFVIVDDYGAIPACRQAVEDFRTPRNISDPFIGSTGLAPIGASPSETHRVRPASRG